MLAQNAGYVQNEKERIRRFYWGQVRHKWVHLQQQRLYEHGRFWLQNTEPAATSYSEEQPEEVIRNGQKQLKFQRVLELQRGSSNNSLQQITGFSCKPTTKCLTISNEVPIWNLFLWKPVIESRLFEKVIGAQTKWFLASRKEPSLSFIMVWTSSTNSRNAILKLKAK